MHFFEFTAYKTHFALRYKLIEKIIITMSYHNRRLLSAKSEHACSSQIQMQKLGSAQLVCKLHERHDHPSHVVCHSPPLDYIVFVIVISGLPLFPRIMFFHSITWTSAAMHCNRATFLSHGQGGAPPWSKAALTTLFSVLDLSHTVWIWIWCHCAFMPNFAELNILVKKLKRYSRWWSFSIFCQEKN